MREFSILRLQRYNRTTGKNDWVDLLGSEQCHLLSWEPRAPGPKQGGVWRDSPLVSGRRPLYWPRENWAEEFTFEIKTHSTDAVALITQDIRRMLDRAVAYWTSMETDPTILVARAPGETNTRYAVVYAGSAPQDRDVSLMGTLGANVGPDTGYPEWQVVIEHGPWTTRPDFDGECVPLSAGVEDAWNFYAAWALATAAPDTEALCQLNLVDRILVGAGVGGCYRSLNGIAWNNAVGLPADQVVGLAQTKSGIYAHMMNGGVYRSVDNGANFAIVHALVDPWGIQSLAYNPVTNRLLGTGVQGGNDGIFWGMDTAAPVNVVNWPPMSGAICISPDGHALAGQYDELYYSNDDFTTSTPVWRSTARDYQIVEILHRSRYGRGWVVLITDITAATSEVLICDADDPTSIPAPPFRSVISIPNPVYRIAETPLGDWNGFILLDDDTNLLYILDESGQYYRTEALPAADWYGVAGQHPITEDYLASYQSAAGGDLYKRQTTFTAGRFDTCADEVYITNHEKPYNLDTVWVFDASGPTYTSILPAGGALPVDLLPAVPALNDAIYFTIATAPGMPAGSSPTFSSLVFDIGDILEPTNPAAPPTIVWEYSQGGGVWATLNVVDTTNTTGMPFDTRNVQSVCWQQPTAWAQQLVNGVTAFWVRVRISAIGGGITTVPTQQNRDIYTVSWAHVDLDGDDVPGDMEALARVVLPHVSDPDGPIAGAALPALWDNRLLLASRSLDRGAAFTPFMNASDLQNFFPITCTLQDVVLCAFVGSPLSPTGRAVRFTPGGAAVEAARLYWDVTGADVRAWYGKYRVFLRVVQTGGTAGDFYLRFMINTGQAGTTWYSDTVWTANVGSHSMYDFGEVSVPVGVGLMTDELIDRVRVVVVCGCAPAGAVGTLDFLDCILWPIDEYSLDNWDTALSTTSANWYGRYADVDSISHPREPLRVTIRNTGTDTFPAVWQPRGAGPFMLKAHKPQRLYVLSVRRDAALTTIYWNAQNAVTHRAQAFVQPAYETLRGGANR